jgi:hypothetical protein
MFDGTGPGSLQATCTDILVSRTNSLELRPADHDRPDKSAVLILVHNRKNSDYFTHSFNYFQFWLHNRISIDADNY